jgi:glycosyltransferase involved in cell wall biosynthesis
VRMPVRKTVTLGWVGTHVNLFYLKRIEKALVAVFQEFGSKLVLEIIADRLAVSFDPAIRIKFTPWSLQKEIENLRHFEIGLSPNASDRWSKGKCSFKALQYAGLGIPAICSRTGFFTDLFRNGRDIFYADSDREWVRGLTNLIRSRTLRQRVGANSCKVIQEHFSARKNAEKLKEIFGKLMDA